MPVAALVALAVATVALTPVRGTEPSKEADLAARVRQLEEKVARLEQQLAGPTPAAPADAIPFGDVVTNLQEDRGQRYVRLRITFRVDQKAHRELTGAVAAKRAELRTWIITHLAGKSQKDVSGAAGVTGLRDDLREGLGKILQGDQKENPIKEVQFEEYVVQ